ncbi:MobF family relaxase [Lentzea jiangxiensis]|uniref:Conjugative relaxase domain-containing protein, TrwC/TraI family n=1 Tax=Lentzea jiangxiensis TaxID=641025 RepID=A0A1H0X4Q3_9PSEU|nr:MobF family relaxase [Lentzea jiangxiensis]SDP97809.1 conjugative relaxase domain-containing protein, TrwC/TraI family [Lentzea jiangxiensis]
MSWVTPIGSAPEQIDYRLWLQHGCGVGGSDGSQLEYSAGTERPLIWIGRALAELGIEAGTELTPDQHPLARALMDGLHPRTGEQLVELKRGLPVEAKVPIAQLVRMIEGVAREADVDVSEVLRHRQGRWCGTTSKRMLDMFHRARRAVAREGELAMLRADHAGQLADAAELRLDAVWEAGVYEAAAANLIKTVSVVADDGTRTEVVVDNRVIVGNRGYDITLTLPKSFSVLREFVDEETGRELDAIYTDEGAATFAWMETNTAYGMRGHHGDGSTASTIAGNGFAGWAMIHSAARPAAGRSFGDPHWHVHYTIANMTMGSDGRWSTVAAGGRDLMRHIPVAAKLLHGSVRRVLTERYGVSWRRSERTGQWEVASIPDAAIKEFSQRGADIRAMLLDLGFTEQEASRSLKRMVQQETRGAKQQPPSEAARREHYRQRALEAGLDPDGMAQLSSRPLTPEDIAACQPTVEELVVALQDANSGLTAHARRFSRIDALAAVVDALPNGGSREAVEALTDEVLQHVGFVPLVPGADETSVIGGGRKVQLGAGHMANAQLYTTRDIVAAEQVIVAAARASHDEQSPVRVSRAAAEMAASAVEAGNGFLLSTEQRRELINIVTSGRRIDALIGGPGSGKTTLMQAVRSAYETAGFVVAGASTQGVAAQNLQAASGIHSRTVAQWRWRIEHGEGLRGIDVLIVDEAGMTNDRDRAVLYRAAEVSGTKILEIFDPKQLRGVGCGSMVAVVHKMVDGGALLDNRRQTDEDERAAVAAWRDGNYVDALTSWADRDRLTVGKNNQDTTVAMLATWIDQRNGAPDAHTEMRGLLMVANTNDQVDRLNAGAQAVRRLQGELGRSRTYELRGGHTLELHENDHVLVRLNDRNTDEPDAFNGYRGVITQINDTGHLTVTWTRAAPGGFVHETRTFDPAYVTKGGLTHGYALTAHKSQGLTINATWTGDDGQERGGSVLYRADGFDNRSFLVATSRHTRAVWTFASQQDFNTRHDAHLHGETTSTFARRRRVITKMADRAKATEVNANDRPILVDLNLLADHPHPGQHARAASHHWSATDAQRDAAEELFRDVWLDHAAVEAVRGGRAFDTVARLIERMSAAEQNPRDVLLRVDPAVLVRPGVRDASRIVAAALNRAAQLANGEQADQTSRGTYETRQRERAAQLLHEAWNNHPSTDLVISGAGFGALARNLAVGDRTDTEVRNLLKAINPDELQGKENPAAFVAQRVRHSMTASASSVADQNHVTTASSTTSLELLVPTYERTLAQLQSRVLEQADTSMPARAPVNFGGVWPSWLPQPPVPTEYEGRDRAVASAASADAKRIRARMVELARDAVRRRPEWVEQLGPAPEGAAQTARYLAAVAVLAAYREQHGITASEPVGHSSAASPVAYEAARAAEQQAKWATAPPQTVPSSAGTDLVLQRATRMADASTDAHETSTVQRPLEHRVIASHPTRDVDHPRHSAHRGPRPGF